MKIILRHISVCLLCIGFITTSCSQQKAHKPFHEDIQAFKDADKTNPPAQNGIVFVGSSSFTMWQDVHNYFPGYPIINRGFGGSSLTDAIEYADDVVIPYHPKQVVIYSGENDVAAGNVYADEVFGRFTKLFKILRDSLPRAHIAYVSMKPSPSRQHLMPIFDSANNKIREFLGGKDNTAFVDVYHKMLDAAGKPRPELFLDDMLHMKPEGYKIWQGSLQPVLLK
jgi:lysophospholipase L1-like esterase